MEKQIRVDAALLLRLIGQQFGGLPLPSGKRQNAKNKMNDKRRKIPNLNINIFHLMC